MGAVDNVNPTMRDCIRCGETYFDDKNYYCPSCDVEVAKIDLERGVDSSKSPEEIRIERARSQAALLNA